MRNRSYIHGHQNHPHFIPDRTIRHLRKAFENHKKYQETVLILKNLSDPTKLRIYLLLQRVKEIPVSDMVYILDINQSAASHALADLKQLGLIDSRRCGRLICYFLKKLKNPLVGLPV